MAGCGCWGVSGCVECLRSCVLVCAACSLARGGRALSRQACAPSPPPSPAALPAPATHAQGHDPLRERARAPGPHALSARRPRVAGLHAALPAQRPPAVAGVPGGQQGLPGRAQEDVHQRRVADEASEGRVPLAPLLSAFSFIPPARFCVYLLLSPAILPGRSRAPTHAHARLLFFRNSTPTPLATRCGRRCKPDAFKQFTEAVVNLKFEEAPLYAAYIALFEPLCGASAPARPLQVENAIRVSGLCGDSVCFIMSGICG